MGLLLFFIPLGAPAVVGFKLLAALSADMPEARNRFRLFASLLTLKPFLATPLWCSLLTMTLMNAYFWMGLLPGPALTVALVLGYRAVLREPYAEQAWELLRWDAVRWGSSALFTTLLHLSVADKPAGISNDGGLVGLTGLAALAMPTVFALIAKYQWSNVCANS